MKRFNWNNEIEKLNNSKRGKRKYQLSSPGVAQVTRVRLLNEWDGLYAWTEGSTLTISVDPQ